MVKTVNDIMRFVLSSQLRNGSSVRRFSQIDGTKPAIYYETGNVNEEQVEEVGRLMHPDSLVVVQTRFHYRIIGNLSLFAKIKQEDGFNLYVFRNIYK